MALELGSSESWLLPLLYKNKKILLILIPHPYPFPFALKPFAGKWTSTQQRKKKCGNSV